MQVSYDLIGRSRERFPGDRHVRIQLCGRKMAEMGRGHSRPSNTQTPNHQ